MTRKHNNFGQTNSPSIKASATLLLVLWIGGQTSICCQPPSLFKSSLRRGDSFTKTEVESSCYVEDSICSDLTTVAQINPNVYLPILLLEEWYNLVWESLSGFEALRVQHHLSYELAIRLCHSQAPEQFFQIVGQVGTSRITRVHGDEYGHVRVDLDLLTNQLNHDLWSCNKYE